MKVLFLLLLMVHAAMASEFSLRSVKQPIYLLESGDGEPFKIIDVPFVSSYADPEWRFSAIATPYTPCHDSSWRQPRDLNLVSTFGIKILGTYNDDNDGYKVTIDCTKAQRPENHSFTIQRVVEATKDCIKQMCPELKDEKFKLEIEVIGLKEEANPEAP